MSTYCTRRTTVQVQDRIHKDGLPLGAVEESDAKESENKNNNYSDEHVAEGDDYGEYVDLGFTAFNNLTKPAYGAEGAPCMSHVLSVMFAWIGRHKATEASAEDVWGMLGMLLPTDHNLPAYNFAKNIIDAHQKRTVDLIDICPCDKTAYMDLISGPLKWHKNAQRTFCPRPKCGLSRWVKVNTPHGIKDHPRKVMYYLPIAHFLRDIFRNKTLPPKLYHDAGDHPPGANPRHILSTIAYIWNTIRIQIVYKLYTNGIPNYTNCVRIVYKLYTNGIPNCTKFCRIVHLLYTHGMPFVA
jgi:hypothetical protein